MNTNFRALIVLLLSVSAMAADIDIGLGYTKAEMPTNGRWWQKPFENDIDRESPSAHIGLRFHPTDNLDFLTGIKYLGHFQSKAKASASDYNYAQYRKGEAEIWPLSTWIGHGSAHGLYGIFEYDLEYFHVKAGAWYHMANWTMTIPDWRALDEDAPGHVPREPRYLKVRSEAPYQLGWVAGIGKRFGPLSVDYEVWETTTGSHYPSSYVGYSQNLSITYIF